MTNAEILSVSIEAVKGRTGDFATAKQTSDNLVKAYIELNGGSTKISPKTFHRGNALFELVQELLPVIIEEGIQTETNPLFTLLEYRNLNDGDQAEFVIEGDANFVVATAANGIRDVRRQRIVGGETVSIPTELKIVRVYENLGRLLAGRIDFSKFVEGVAKAFKNHIAEAAYDAINGLSAATYGLDETYVHTGSYTEDALIALIDHVEAATGEKATIVGTRAALRKLETAIVADSAKEDMYNIGYVGKFNGTDVIRMNQAHKVGTSTFALNDNKIWVLAGSDRPIKVVNSGEGLLIEREPGENADLTQEYVYAQPMGIGAICASKIGVMTLA
jgi:hypothetical protein